MRIPRPTRAAARDHAIERIRELLMLGPASRATICEAIGLNENTCSMYLGYMRKELRLIRVSERKSFVKALEWELGEDPSLPPEDSPTQSSVPARQLGIARDPLVAALFGPAAQAAAA